MELSDKIKYCAICQKSKRDMQRGIVCGLTNEKPTFEKQCADLQASANDIAELEESLMGGSQKHATKLLTAVLIVAFLRNWGTSYPTAVSMYGYMVIPIPILMLPLARRKSSATNWGMSSMMSI